MTHDPYPENREWAIKQIRECIGNDFVIVSTRQSLTLLRVREPYETWSKLKKCLLDLETPIHRIVPVDEVVDPLVKKVAERAKVLANERIPENATYRITLHGHLYDVDERGRLTQIHTIDAIRVIAQGIPRKVNLSNPEWVVYIRIVPVRRWFVVATLSVARAFVFKNVRIREFGDPLRPG